MNTRTAWAFAFLLFIQAMSAALYVTPGQPNEDTWNGPILESGARSHNNSSSGCGHDLTNASVAAYSSYSVYDIGDTFFGGIQTNCGIYNAQMMIDWNIHNQDSNTSIDVGSYNWTVTTSVYLQTNLNSSALSTSPVGNYSFDVTFSWYNNSSMTWELVDTDYESFVVMNMTSGGGGNNSTPSESININLLGYSTINQAGSMGTWASGAALGGEFISSNLNQTNYSMTWALLSGWSSTQIINQGNASWYAYTNSSTENVNFTSLADGQYMFQIYLYTASGNFLDSDMSYMEIGNASGGNNSGGNNSGGNNSTPSESININLLGYSTINQAGSMGTWASGAALGGEFISSNLNQTNYSMTWALLSGWSSTQIINQGNASWYAYTNSSTENVNFTSLADGQYMFQIYLYTASGNFLDSDMSYMEIGNASGGNNSGGNNSGGNNSGVMESIDAWTNSSNYSSSDAIDLIYAASDLVWNMSINYNVTADVYGHDAANNTTSIVWSMGHTFSPNGPSQLDVFTIPSNTLSTSCYFVSFNLTDDDDGMFFDNVGFEFGVNMECSSNGGNNSGGNNSGGNNSGGNNTGCYYDLNYSYILVGAYQMNMPLLYENQTFTGTYRPMCSLYEMNHSFSGYLSGPSANDYSTFTMDTYLQSGHALGTQYQSWSNLEVGMYTFYLEWNLNQSGVNTFVDEGWFNFTVISNTSTAPGSSPSNPLMPFNCSDINWNATTVTIQDCQNNPDAFWFVFNQTGGTFWIDPVVAIGYDYIVWSGPNITSVTLPTGYGDDVFDLFMWNGSGWYDTNTDLYGGFTHTFSEEFGVDRLSIRGIEAYEELDPNDSNAFVTGLNFTNNNNVLMTMTPVTVNYTGGNNSQLSEYIDIDHSGYASETSEGLEVWTSGTDVYVQFESANLNIGTNYSMDWTLRDSTGSVVYNGNASWTAMYNSSIENSTISNLQDGLYTFEAYLWSDSSAGWISDDTTYIQMGNSTSGNGTGNNTGGNNNTHGAMFVYIQSGIHGSGIAEQFPLSLHFPAPPMSDNSPYELSQICSVNNGHTVNVFATWVYSEGGNAGDFNNITSWSVKNSNGLQLDHFSYNPMSDIIGFVNPMVVFEDDANWSGHIPAEVFDQAAWECVDSTTGGNNTGGNNTGGNNTGGNNTGGNNTGGNNTGGNNTGGNTTTPPTNTAPSVTAVSISPVIPTDADFLTCLYTYSDAENNMDASTTTWTVNGVAVSSPDGTLSSGFTSGDQVTCIITPSDGIDSGSPVTSTVTILPSEIVEQADGGFLPSLGSVGTLLAIAFGVGLSRRKDD